MKLLEAWWHSRSPYKEVVYRSIAEEKGRMWWGGFGKGQVAEDFQDNLEVTKKALRIAKWDKSLVAVFNILAAIMPFTAQFFGSPIMGLTSAVSLSLAVTFGFMSLYAIQTMSSFVSAESSVLLSVLPLEKNDFSLITLFSFIRSVDYIVLGSILSQVIMVACYTGSPLAVIVILVASVMNAIFAVAVSLWFSRVFAKNLSRGGRSKSRTILRLVFILMWGCLLMGVSLLISLPWYIVPSLETMLLNPNQISNILFCLLPQFSAGVTVASASNVVAAQSITLVAALCMVGYVGFAGFAVNWVLKTVNRISTGADVNITRVTATNFSIKLRSPLFGYVLKDLKSCSRNPSTAFFFALPVLETVIVSFMLASFEVLRASTLIVSTLMGGIFVLLMPLALLNSEGKGLEYTKTLPLSLNRIVTSKTLISTLTFVPVPLVLLVLAFLKSITSPLVILIPFFSILSIASASIFEIQLFLSIVTKGKISALIHDLKKLVVGISTLIIPLLVYAIVYVVFLSHFFAVLSMGVVSISELVLAFYSLKRTK
ncbi:MAG: hypothetical protein IAX21_03285 [Candidatus Bathyarchaeota archaeon]|nr:MAG: hypothetical protein IAX21_03285 [Candidatus Bathyarchaeota archaeon]